MRLNANRVGIGMVGAVLMGLALTGCNSQSTNPDGTTGVAPVTNTSPNSNSSGKGKTDDNMSGRGMNGKMGGSGGNMGGTGGKMGDNMNGPGNHPGSGNHPGPNGGSSANVAYNALSETASPSSLR